MVARVQKGQDRFKPCGPRFLSLAGPLRCQGGTRGAAQIAQHAVCGGMTNLLYTFTYAYLSAKS
jgi:hypothetical protein